MLRIFNYNRNYFEFKPEGISLEDRMSKPKVLLTRPDIPTESLQLLQSFAEVEIQPKERPISKEELITSVRDKDALFCMLTDPVDKEVVDAGVDLKVIATMSVGHEHIDSEAAKARGISVTNTPDVSSNSVAELTVTLMLAAGRRVFEAANTVKRGHWNYSWAPQWLCGHGLAGATIGFVGMGRIAQSVLAHCTAFGIKEAIYYDKFHPREAAEKMGAKFRPLDEVLANADFIVTLTNLNEETRHMYNAETFAKMKKNCVFVNTSRGGVVDQDALYDALKNGVIRAAALDVSEPEPLPAYSKLLTLDNLIVTPHIGSAETNVRVQMATLAVNNIKAVLEGRPAITPVNL
ncbi:glyoxylate reductase/hydroxypyruvate reductase-like isoform X2 [Varroa destructor]|uniref:Glyoxylate reductase/hydroxypyruvate reductase n=1 Tax=Varroa destructor TaxID=109461 RepID=A0A7M7KN82_VARDE|nr:glyoxylate reductase/hydroxypyruvate reductase-like isoform X2 [Varroa destructor]